MPETFFKMLSTGIVGVGETPEEADKNMLEVWEQALKAYKRGKRFVHPQFSVLIDDDPGGGGPCALIVRRVAEWLVDTALLARIFRQNKRDD